MDRIVLPRLAETESKKKRKRSKKKAAVDPSSPSQLETTASEPVQVSSGPEREPEMMPPVEPSGDHDNVLVSIPRDASLFNSPSDFDRFSKGLLLEIDEERLAGWGPLEVSRRAATLSYQALECSMYLNKAVESSQRRNKDLEKSNTSLRKSSAEAMATAQAAEGRARELEVLNQQLEASLKLEKEVAQMEKEAHQHVVESFEKQKVEWAEKERSLTDQLLGIAYRGQLQQRNEMSNEYLAGGHVKWTPEKWIRSYEKMEAGVEESSEEEEDDEGEADLPVSAPAPAPTVADPSSDAMEVEPTQSLPALD